RSPTAPPEEWPTYVYREEIHLVLAARGLVWAAIHAERLEWVDHVVAACANTVDFYGELQGDFPQGGVAVEPEPDPLHWSWWSERVDQCFLLATAPVRARMTDLAEGA
ncbi:MAG: hypothetical protein KIT58_08015, partial [Planctomycetota bacterium]|nr:hypothetical protein [Planctomycetota bacterium]